MELFFNDLSLHRQFPTAQAFLEAFGRLMAMRAIARRQGRELYCHRMLANTEPVQGMAMQQVIAGLGKDERGAVLSWINRNGPFWDDSGLQWHSPDDYLEHKGDVVTESAVGEAAYRKLHYVECGLVSAAPSNWLFSPVEVVWRRGTESLDDKTACIENWWCAAALENGLQVAATPIRSWNDLRDTSASRFRRLTFATNCFEPLAGFPFSQGASKRFLVLLGILDQFTCAFDAAGGRTVEGQRIYQDYFTGDNALFSDSSSSEKHDFRKELRFPHPDREGESIFCPWHGKVRHMTLRLHFSWPIRKTEPVYVVYAGPKITSR